MDLIYDRLKLSNRPVQYTLQALKKRKKRKERKLEALLEKHGIHGVCTSSKCPRRHLSVFAKLQTMWMVHASYTRHWNIIYSKQEGMGVLSISLISMEILFGTISHTSLSVSTAKPLDIERDGCSSSNHS